MKKLKKLSILAGIVVIAMAIAFTACSKDDKKADPADLGKKAAQEMCPCMEKKTQSAKAVCANEVLTKYDPYLDDKDFNTAFFFAAMSCDGLFEWLLEFED